MKQFLFTSSSRLILVWALTTVVFSCKKSAVTDIPDEQNVASTGNVRKPNTVAEVYLKLTVNDASANKITSDSGGDYQNGLQNVGAKFDQYGNFIFGCGSAQHGPNATPSRWLNVNFDSPIEVFITPPLTGNDKITAMTTVPGAAFPGTVPLQNMAVGTTQCITLTGGSNANWVANFHRGAEDVSSSPSAYAVVSHPSSTVWTITPAGSCSPNSNVAALRNGPEVLYGYYNLPFYFTLTKI